uniref:FYVE, RhoGEF and PH domain containing 2 n=1 Tax=Sphenodon punctatus TaxID=8508 RepID=A0A8D0H094_SPHPU
MEEDQERESRMSVFNLVTVFEHPREVSPCRSPHKEQIHSKSGPHLAVPGPTASKLLPSTTGRIAVSETSQHRAAQKSQMSQSSESAEMLQQASRGLPVKCLRSFKCKIINSNWRTQKRTDSDSSSGGSRNQDSEEKKIALELLETEQAYVTRLHLLDQVFYTELLKEARGGRSVPEDVVKMIFSNISSIYQFHAQFFLPELQKRMRDWSSNPRIGDIIQKVAPFLKMYGEYVKNFDKAVELITTWSEKSLPFQELIAEIQKREICASLTLQHHMLEPVQRIPRYELLLKDYVRKLPLESPDREDAEKALEMIFTAAKYSNAAIAEMFNNMLLYCVPKVIQVGAEFQVRWRIDVEGMKVRELNDAEFPNAFLVSGKQRTLELQARSQEEMNAWLKACQDAIEKNEKRNESFKAAVHGPEGETQELNCQSEELGKRAPLWVRDKLATMCMRCKEPFNSITRRRHHCRACGYVVCARCSDYKAQLQYDMNRPNRVCLECYVFLTGHLVHEEREGKHKGILEKESAELSGRSLMCSFLQLLDKNGKGGVRGWFVIPQDDPLVLYIYAAPQDVKAHTSIPLLGYQVKEVPQSEPRHLFQLIQSRQVYTFLAETEELKQRWMKTMEQSSSGNVWLPGEEEEEEDSFDDLE